MPLTGTEFESLVKPFFELIFKKVGFIGADVRNQKSGTQSGFDIKIIFNDNFGKKRDLRIECKYYSSTLNWALIARKQFQIWSTNQIVDGFILLSPKENLSNIDEQIKDKIDKQWLGFPNYYWTPEYGIKELFALDKIFYEKVYDSPCDIEIIEEEQLSKFKTVIQNLLNDKDFPTKELPIKNKYNAPIDYIKRKIIESDSVHTYQFFNSGKNLIDVLKEENKIALLGHAGTGKSVELERLAYELSNDNFPYYPFHVKLNIYTDKAIKDYIPKISDLPENIIVLILDGLDEVQSKDFVTVSRKIAEFTNEYPESKIVVSCRSNFYITNENIQQNTLRGFKSYFLCNLQPNEIEFYIENKCSLKKNTFLKEVENKNLKNLLSIPYYLVKLTEQYINNGKVADTKSDLFEQIIKENIKKDIIKYFPEGQNIEEPRMRNIIEKLAFILEYVGKNNCSWEELQKIFTPEELKIIKSSGSLIDGIEGNNSLWKFNHNNSQEYLVAKFLSNKKFNEIKETVAFERPFKKIKPSWANTLSFLMTILHENSKLRIKILNWIIRTQPELIIKFEPDRLTEQIRFNVFSGILNYYKENKRKLNHVKYNYHELAKFSKSQNSLDFLINELKITEPVNSRYNAIILLRYYDIDEYSTIFKERIKQNLELNVYRNDNDINQVAITTYIELFSLNETEFDKLFNEYKDRSEAWVKSIIYYAINKQNYQDKYIKHLIERIKYLIINENYRSESVINENADIVACITSIKSEDSFVQILNFIREHYKTISHSIEFSSLIDKTISNVIKIHPKSNKLYENIKSIFLNNDSVYYDEKINCFIDFFKKTDNIFDVFKDIYDKNTTNIQYPVIRQLAMVTNDKSIQFLTQEFTEGKIDNTFIEPYQYSLNNINSDLLKLFNSKINQIKETPLPIYRDTEKEEKERKNKTKALLFDKELFKSAIEQVFIDAKKDDLTYDEIWEIQKTEYEGKYLPIVYETTRIYRNNEKRNKVKLLKWIEENWNDFSIEKIINFIKNNNNPEFSNSENELIINWCNEAAKKVDFKNSLSQKNENTTSANYNAIRLSYLIRKLHLINYSKELYLDMLSFQQWDDKEVAIFDFVEKIIPKEEIDKRVMKNLSDGIKFDWVLSNHLDYCLKSKLYNSCNLLIPYFNNSSYGTRSKVLETYTSLNGGSEILFSVLNATNDDFKYELIRALIKSKNSNILSHLQIQFNSANNDDEKLLLSKYLIELQNLEGVKFYINYIQEHKQSPDYSSPDNVLYKLKNIKALKYIFKLYELGYDDSIKHDNFNDLKSIAYSAIQEISLSNNNYFKAKRIFKIYALKFRVLSFFKLQKLPDALLNNLYFHFENIEQRFYINKSVNITIEQALDKYSKLSNKLTL